MKPIQYCGICESSKLNTLWELPALPLTERFGKYDASAKLSFDQKLLMCQGCGHVQLGYQLSPEVLYTHTNYSFRTGESKSAIAGTAFFINFLNQIAPDRQFRSLLDVGGNDLYLARQLKGRAAERCVVDPICGPIDGQTVEGIKVFGRMIEKVNLSQDIARPDLVACRHTLEHVSAPAQVIRQLFEECSADCLYVFEIPCFENLVEGMRFDAIFHQHYHYYDIVAFRRLLSECGGEYLGHAYNHQGSCGGAMVIAFKKAKSVQSESVDLAQRTEWVIGRLAAYQQQMAVASQMLKQMPKKVYGYGASLMLAMLSYHLNTDFNELECVLDDDQSKNGMTYENVPVVVKHPDTEKPPQNSCYIITSLENARPIYRRIQDFKPRRILMPLIS